jgi:Tfp pilus assembly protein PilF
LGRGDEARSWLDKTLKNNPENYQAWYQIGLLNAATDRAAAQAAYEKTIVIQPNFSAGQRELGMLLFQQKDFAAAAVHIEKSIALGLEDARLHNFLGICYNHTNRTTKAIAEFRLAIAMDPTLAEAHLNLAYAEQLLRHDKVANDEYAIACRLDGTFCKYGPGK